MFSFDKCNRGDNKNIKNFRELPEKNNTEASTILAIVETYDKLKIIYKLKWMKNEKNKKNDEAVSV